MKKINRNQRKIFFPLTKEDMNKLVDFARSSENPIEKMLIFLPGKLAFRLGELIHLSKNWINLENETITIPRYQSCDCCYCKKRKRALIRNGRSAEELTARYWRPKSPTCSRTIYYGFDPDLIQTISDFYNAHEWFSMDEMQIYKRLEEIGNDLDIENLSFHVLRNTAITNFFLDGLSYGHVNKMLGYKSIDSHCQPTFESLKRELMQLYGSSKAQQHDSIDSLMRELMYGSSKAKQNDSKEDQRQNI